VSVWRRNRITIPDHLIDALHRHEQACAPYEAAGLLATKGDVVTDFYPVTNQNGSATSYSIDGGDVLTCADRAEAFGERLGGVVHSHPSSSTAPSETDLVTAAASDWIYLITSRGELAAYRIIKGRAVRLQVLTIPAE